MITMARRVECTIRKGRTMAAYMDMVILDAGPLAGSLALVNPLVPAMRPDYIQKVLTREEAIDMLKAWVHMERPDRTGSYSAVTRDGRKWLKEVAKGG